eukprot:TRINITY_DN26449_c0_g1_i1.p1 TRINITY_DN26449_c0_g1~~TRINITY_DN26449_c0_g1_i1.p1  ORF type:complete len:126 (-),score=5.62 TRINITY_DN26449_c0_g1_i1:105-482(-)
MLHLEVTESILLRSEEQALYGDLEAALWTTNPWLIFFLTLTKSFDFGSDCVWEHLLSLVGLDMYPATFSASAQNLREWDQYLIRGCCYRFAAGSYGALKLLLGVPLTYHIKSWDIGWDIVTALRG